MKLLLRKFPPEFQPKSGEVRISSLSSKGFKRGDILRITSPDGNGKSIIRQLIKTNNYETEQYIDLDYDSRLKLGIDKYLGRKVGITIRKASRFAFYWFHPSHGIRLTFQIGIPGLLIAIISLIVTLYPPLNPIHAIRVISQTQQTDSTGSGTPHSADSLKLEVSK